MLFSVLGFEITLPVLTLGTVVGLTYGLLGVGLVLIYRTNKIINFAHGEIGAFAAAVVGLLAVNFGVPYYVALPVGLLVAVGTGGLTEVAVVRRLRNAPKLMSVVATLGVGQFLLLFRVVINTQAAAGSSFPEPPGLPSFRIGPLLVTQAHSGMLLLTPILVVALALFLRRSRFGLAIRGAAANRDAARLAGIFAARTSSLAWAIAGGISAFTAVLYLPTLGFASSELFGPSLLLRALVAGVIGRMTSLPRALAGGVMVGIVEQELLWNFRDGGLVQLVLFAIVLIALLVQRRGVGAREEDRENWAALQVSRPLPDAFRQLWAVRNLPRLVAGVALVVAALLPLVVSNSNSITLVSIIAFAIVGLSVGIVTGLGGQLSLGQFALGAIGAVVSFYVSSRTGNFFLSFLYAGLGGAVASLVIGLPALRIKGLFLTVTTLGFALATPWLLGRSWMLGEGVDPGAPIVGSVPLDNGRSYYLFALAVLVVVVWLARNVRRGGIGRRLIAIRDNEENARAFTIPAAVVKIQGFMLSGFVAGIGGAVLGHSLSLLGDSDFPVGISIDVVVMSVVGGIGVLSGPLLGALFVIGMPAFVPLDSAGIAASNFGLLLVILYVPAGLAQFLPVLRDRIVDRYARSRGLDVDAIRAAEASDAAEPDDAGLAGEVSAELDGRDTDAPPVRIDSRDGDAATYGHPRRRPHGTVLLQVEGMRRHFGGVRAVDGVNLRVRAGETVGLIGPNGAGKTTLFELIGGFVQPDAGSVAFASQDITRAGPEERARRGLIRSFQDAALFPTMTVLDTVRLALEKVAPTPFFRSLLGATRFERDRDRRARQVVSYLGLDRYRDKQIRELSTGTRRIAELACLVALEPRMLLLDEPSSGIAQRETESLGALLDKLKADLDTTLLVIEHDMPLIMGLADRILAMDTGRIIARGAPEEVRADPGVVEAYLGGSVEAIQRSGTRSDSERLVTGGDGGTRASAGTTVAAPPQPTVSLDAVRGLGPVRRQALLAEFGSVQAMREATAEQLRAVPGVGARIALRIHEELDGQGP